MPHQGCLMDVLSPDRRRPWTVCPDGILSKRAAVTNCEKSAGKRRGEIFLLAWDIFHGSQTAHRLVSLICLIYMIRDDKLSQTVFNEKIRMFVESTVCRLSLHWEMLAPEIVWVV